MHAACSKKSGRETPTICLKRRRETLSQCAQCAQCAHGVHSVHQVCTDRFADVSFLALQAVIFGSWPPRPRGRLRSPGLARDCPSAAADRPVGLLLLRAGSGARQLRSGEGVRGSAAPRCTAQRRPAPPSPLNRNHAPAPRHYCGVDGRRGSVMRGGREEGAAVGQFRAVRGRVGSRLPGPPPASIAGATAAAAPQCSRSPFFKLADYSFLFRKYEGEIAGVQLA
jgi:hypothetical protein